MRYCTCCRDADPEGCWQPFGPAATPTEPTAFPRPGFHARGFPVLPLCTTCRDLLKDGARVHFRVKGQWWHCEGDVLTRQEAP